MTVMEISQKEWDDVKHDIAEIKIALIGGGEYNNGKGLLWVVEDHHRRISDLEEYRDQEIMRLKFQQERDKRNNNLLKTALVVITILSIFLTWYKNH
jgi:exopolysaccharide biosynthesis predicted pyruvyltransferase EpsI